VCCVGTSNGVVVLCWRRYGDNIKKVWELKFRATKRLEEVYEFFLRIYPHTQLGGAKRVVHIYHRGELAAAGFPDGEQSDSSSASEGEEEVGEGEGEGGNGSESGDSSVNSVSDDSDGEQEVQAKKETAEPALKGAVRPVASSSALSAASSTGSTRRAAAAVKIAAATGRAVVAVAVEASAEVHVGGDRRSGRKRPSIGAGAAVVGEANRGASAPAAATEESKRRKR
jgi:hypothetical protein